MYFKGSVRLSRFRAETKVSSLVILKTVTQGGLTPVNPLRCAEIDLPDRLRRCPDGDRAGLDVAVDDRVGADDAAVADADAAGDGAVDAEPAVGADPHRPLRGEALPGDR